MRGPPERAQKAKETHRGAPKLVDYEAFSKKNKGYIKTKLNAAKKQ